MTESGPSILVVDGDWDERRQIASVLREAGFDVVAKANGEGALSALGDRRFAAAVVALPDGEGIDFLRRAQWRQAGLKALLVVDPAALRLVEEDYGALVRRPFDPRQLLGCVFAMVLREDERGPIGTQGHAAAEFGIAAAKLVCLQNRRVAAAAAGAHRLAQELAHQIGETAALSCGLSTVMQPGRLALVP